MKLWKFLAILATAFLLVTSCSSSEDGETSNGDGTDKQSQTAKSSQGSTSDTGGSASGGTSGTLTLDGAAIELTGVRCYLEPQNAAAGGGKILFTGQGVGKDTTGADVRLDVSHYDADSQFAGDDITVNIGEITNPDSYGLQGSDSPDVISKDGSTISAQDVELNKDDRSETKTVSFELHC